jgi:hypothetical protein
MRKLLLKTVLAILPVLLFVSQQGFAQCTLSCPSNVSVPADAGKCGAMVTYTTPTVPAGCSSTQNTNITFAFTGTQQTFVVPAGVNSITIQTFGAQGGGALNCPNSGGLGGYATGTLAVQPGNVLYVYVGGQPVIVTTPGATYPGGYNGGGNYTYRGGGGGGASDVRAGDISLSNRVIVAGGGGGGVDALECRAGGTGGGLNGTGGSGANVATYNGGGGTQSGGGAAGYVGEGGSLGQGGNAIQGSGLFYQAGGGGGYYGGGSARLYGAGGGSGYVGGVTDGTMQTGVNSGNGKILFSYNVTAPPPLVQTAGLSSGALFPVGTTTNTFALVRSAGDTVSRCSSTVTVTDNEKPVLICPGAQKLCFSTSGTYTIPQLVASDNCGVQSTSYSITGATTRSGTGNDASGAFNPGVSTITYTVTDIHGNQNTCQSTVTFNPQIIVSIPDVKALSSGVSTNTVYVGYAPASALTLTTNASGGSGGFTYKWSTGATTNSITVSPATTTTYSVVVTDASGCTATAFIQVKVVDIRCGNKNDKVSVCHNGHTICIDQNAVPAHLQEHGDYLGACSTASMTSTATSSQPMLEALMMNNSAAGVYPNPNNGQFSLQLNNSKAAKAEVLVINANGSVVERRPVYLTAGTQTLRFTLNNKAIGLYLVKVISDAGVQVLKVNVQR